MRTVIVGNGIVALATAFELVREGRPGDELRIIGLPAREGSATLAAAAMLNSFAELETDSLTSELDRLRFELSRDATAQWPAFGDAVVQATDPAGTIAQLGFGTGTYVLANPAAGELDERNLDAILDALRTYDEPHALVSPAELPQYDPEPRLRATRAVQITHEGWINPRLVIAQLDRALAAAPGVERIVATATRLRHRQGTITGVELDDGRLVEGDRYLLATGAQASGLLDELGLPIQQVFHGLGVSLELHSPGHGLSHCLRTPNRGLAGGVYSAPYDWADPAAADHVFIGATNTVIARPATRAPLGSVELLARAAFEQVNQHLERAELVRVNVGWRPISEDTYPLLGATSIANLVIASGTRRDGIHLAPVLASHLCALLHGEPVDPRLAVFAPERAPLRSLTRAHAIDKAVRQHLASHPRRPDPQLERDALERLHDEVGAHTWGIPPELLDVYRAGHVRRRGGPTA